MIFVDTSFWVAFRNTRDSLHDEASVLLKEQVAALITTNHVRGETWTFLRRRVGHHAAVNFLDSIEQSTRVKVAQVSEDLEHEAFRWLRRHDERAYSFVDATSFLLMKKMKIREALAFDEDFTVAGFRVLRADG